MGASFSATPLAPQALAGSSLQLCLNNAFASNMADVSYPQHWLYHRNAVRVHNTDVPVVPAAVVRPRTSEQVSLVVQCAAASGVKVQARGGGHSYANYGLGGIDGAVVVDMVNFQQFEMDQQTWRARVGSGTLLGNLKKQLRNSGGRAMAHGSCPQVGIGGHATIGGLGPVSRQWGTAMDHVEEVEIVLANGTITRANSNLHPDIFFAAKGAAAGFGVITEFVVRTHPEPKNIHHAYHIITDIGWHSRLAKNFQNWQSIISDPALTRKFASQVILYEKGMIVMTTYFGTKKEYRRLKIEERLSADSSLWVLSFNGFFGNVLHLIERTVVHVMGRTPKPFYSKSLTFTQDTLLSEAGIKDLFKYAEESRKGTPTWFAIFDLAGGAVNDIPANATAFPHRDALFYLQSYAIGLWGVSATTKAFVQGMNDVISNAVPESAKSTYVGYIDPQLSNAQERYWGPNLPRLERIKALIDPADIFHNPQSVRPHRILGKDNGDRSNMIDSAVSVEQVPFIHPHNIGNN